MQLLDEFLSMLREYGKDAVLVIVSLLGGSLISLYFYRKALQRSGNKLRMRSRSPGLVAPCGLFKN